MKITRRDPAPELHPTFPYATPVALLYDTGKYEAHLDHAMQVADVAGYPARKAAAAEGQAARPGLQLLHRSLRPRAEQHRGRLGRARRPVRGRRGARASHRHGDGVHRLAQPRPGPRNHLRAGGRERLGIPVENVEIVHGDTGRVPFGMGTYGRRSLSVGGTAIVKAVDKIIAKGKKIAAHLLEAADTDIEFENGEFKVKGTDRSKAFGDHP